MKLKSPGARAPQIAADELPLQSLYRWERTLPDHIVMTQPFDGGQLRHYTWREVADEARRMAAFLRAQGWPDGSRIAILGKNSAGWIIADLAIWMAGHVSVPLFPMQTADNVRQTMDHSEAVACLIGKLDDTGLLAGIENRVLTLALPLAGDAALKHCATTWGDVLAHSEPLHGEPVRDGDELATIIYTSGTTGQAKGVMHTFETLTSGWTCTAQAIDAPDDECQLSYLPLAHCMERVGVEIASLHMGKRRCFFVESLATFADDLRRARPSVFVSVPRLWLKFQQGVLERVPQRKLSRLLKIPLLGAYVKRKILRGLGLDRARFGVSGSAPLATDLLHWFAALGLPIVEGYGMTEVANASHIGRPGELHYGTVGPPVAMVDHRIDPATGEVQVLTPGATPGYYKAPKLTGELFTSDGWVRTGDKGVIDAKGCLSIVGRIKDNFKSSKGKYVSPAPIEHKLAQHQAIESCLVVGANLPQPIGIIVLNDNARASLPAAKAALAKDFERHLDAINATLDPHEQLDCIVLTTTVWSPDNGLLTPTLKARRPQIEQRFAALFEVWTSARTPVVWAD